MSGDVRRALRLLVLPTVALAVVAVLVPGRLDPALRAYALLVSAVALGVAVAFFHRTYPPAGRLGRTRDDRAARPEPVRSLAQLENLAVLGVADAQDLHFRLRPRVRAVAAGVLEARRGISLDGEPDAARATLGDEAWELVRADRPAPEDRRAPGIPQAALARVVDALERV